jgi:hypothetical protein
LTLAQLCTTPPASLTSYLGKEVSGWRLAPIGRIKKYVKLVKDANDSVRFQQTLVCDGDGGFRFALQGEPASNGDAHQLNNGISFSAVSDAGILVTTADPWTLTGGGSWKRDTGFSFAGTFSARKFFDGDFMPVLTAWRIEPPGPSR